MNEKCKIEHLKEKIAEADAIVIGMASGMSAAGGLRYFYQDDEDYKRMIGGLREKYGVRNMFDAYYDRRMTKGEDWALVLRSIKYLYDIEVSEPHVELKEILDGKNYYIVRGDMIEWTWRDCCEIHRYPRRFMSES